jgi:hypothetical protein
MGPASARAGAARMEPGERTLVAGSVRALLARRVIVHEQRRRLPVVEQLAAQFGPTAHSFSRILRLASGLPGVNVMGMTTKPALLAANRYAVVRSWSIL